MLPTLHDHSGACDRLWRATVSNLAVGWEEQLMTFCPATMCPLFAPDGSPWTGERNAPCPQDHAKCGWFRGFNGDGCDACVTAISQIYAADEERPLVQLKVIVLDAPPPRMTKTAPTTFDCHRAHECQWQAECAPALCPPRYALSLGLDPRVCAY